MVKHLTPFVVLEFGIFATNQIPAQYYSVVFFLKGDRIQYNAVTICAKVYDDVDDGRVLESKIILSQNITYFCYDAFLKKGILNGLS